MAKNNGISVDEREKRMIMRALTHFKDEMQTVIAENVVKTARGMETKAKENAQSTDLKLGIDTIEDVKNLKATVVSSKGYSAYVEFGTKTKVDVPNEWKTSALKFKKAYPGTFKELKLNIEAWAKRKAISKDAVYAIALDIAKKGRKASPFFYPAFVEAKAKLQKNIVSGTRKLIKSKKKAK